MTRDEQLEHVIHALTQLQVLCGEYGDLETARIAMEAVRQLHKRRSSQQVVRLERAKGIQR